MLAALLRQVRLCLAGVGREILNSNPAERLDDHPFILGLPPVRINGVPFSMILSERRVANHVLVFSISALFQSSELCLFVGHFCIIRRYGVFMSIFVHFLGVTFPYVNEIEIDR